MLNSTLQTTRPAQEDSNYQIYCHNGRDISELSLTSESLVCSQGRALQRNLPEKEELLKLAGKIEASLQVKGFSKKKSLRESINDLTHCTFGPKPFSPFYTNVGLEIFKNYFFEREYTAYQLKNQYKEDPTNNRSLNMTAADYLSTLSGPIAVVSVLAKKGEESAHLIIDFFDAEKLKNFFSGNELGSFTRVVFSKAEPFSSEPASTFYREVEGECGVENLEDKITRNEVLVYSF